MGITSAALSIDEYGRIIARQEPLHLWLTTSGENLAVSRSFTEGVVESELAVGLFCHLDINFSMIAGNEDRLFILVRRVYFFVFSFDCCHGLDPNEEVDGCYFRLLVSLRLLHRILNLKKMALNYSPAVRRHPM